MWHYKHANTDHIRKAICGFNWEKCFASKDINEMVSIFKETISKVSNNFFPHETIICDDQVKKVIQEKNQLFSRVSQILIMILF